MKNLSNLSPARGSNTRNKRLGRGIGSGLGKTAGKGHKGKRARSGSGPGPGFEGGQMPLYRRLPKRGFTNHCRIEYYVVNIEALNRFADGTKVTPELLDQAGLINDLNHPVKILGRGTLTKKLTIAGTKVSGTAKAAVEKLGGKIEET